MVVGWRVHCVCFSTTVTVWMSMIYDVMICEGWTNFMQSQVISFTNQHPAEVEYLGPFTLPTKAKPPMLFDVLVGNEGSGKSVSDEISWCLELGWLPVEGHRCNNLEPVQTSEQLNPDTRHFLQICISGQRQVFLLGRGVFQGNQSQRFLHVSTKVSTEKAYVCRTCSFGRQININ